MQAWTLNLRTASLFAAAKTNPGMRDIYVSTWLGHVPSLNVLIKKAYKKKQQINIDFYLFF